MELPTLSREDETDTNRDRCEPTMNLMDALLLIVTWGLAGRWVYIRGLTPSGIGPAVLLFLGGAWHIGMQWLRHRRWQRHRESGFAPGTQALDLLSATGFLLCVGGAVLWAFLVQVNR